MASSEFSPSIENSETPFHQRRRCFCFPNQLTRCVNLDWWHRLRRSGVVREGSVWAKGINALKKLREWSEIVAGPRWKTFIRRFNRNKSGRNGKFQYDPLSYSLNFDQGPGNNEEEEELAIGDKSDKKLPRLIVQALRNFSTRYASIPASSKVSMDLGKDGPSFV